MNTQFITDVSVAWIRKVPDSWLIKHVNQSPNTHSYRNVFSENLDNREGQTDSTAVDKSYFTWTEKGVRCYPNFDYGGVL